MDRVVTWPNAITVVRMIFGLIGIYIATASGVFLGFSNFFWGILTFFVLGLVPDFFDGLVARMYDQKTRIGEFIDPLADKILFYGAIAALFSQYVWWPGLLVLFSCDTVSTVVHFYKKGGAVRTGKWKFGLQCASLVIFALSALWFPKCVMAANFMIVCALCCAIHSLYYRIRG